MKNLKTFENYISERDETESLNEANLSQRDTSNLITIISNLGSLKYYAKDSEYKENVDLLDKIIKKVLEK